MKNIHIKKQLGQNFLNDENIIKKIVSFSTINQNDFILEICPGNGILTKELLNNCKKLISIEIDKDLISILEKKFNENINFYLINSDFLNLDINILYNKFLDMGLKGNQPIKVVSNIPYYIKSPIIMKLLEITFINEITLMIQKEVADRIIALPNSKDYGILTIIIKYYADVYEGFFVNKKYFNPMPKVDSKVIKIIKHPIIYDDKFKNKFFYVVKNSFLNRRKTLINSLKKVFDKNLIIDAIQKLNTPNTTRAENLSFDDYIKLTQILYS